MVSILRSKLNGLDFAAVKANPTIGVQDGQRCNN